MFSWESNESMSVEVSAKKEPWQFESADLLGAPVRICGDYPVKNHPQIVQIFADRKFVSSSIRNAVRSNLEKVCRTLACAGDYAHQNSYAYY